MALTQYYVDPSLNANSGSGTIGAPYGDLQYALNSITRDATNGDQINVKAGAAEVLAASLTLATYGAPASDAPLVIRGYTSTANDGGTAEINCSGSPLWAANNYSFVTLADLKMYSFGNNNGVVTNQYCLLYGCEVLRGSSTPVGQALVVAGSYSAVLGCYLHDAGTTGIGISCNSGALALGNYITGCSHVAIDNVRNGIALNNIIMLTAVGARGVVLWYGGHAIGNIICQTVAGTGNGIDTYSSNIYGQIMLNNIITGYSGAGGAAINILSGGDAPLVGHNAFYNNTNNLTNSGTVWLSLTANDVTLAADPFTDAANGDFSLTDTAKTALRSAGWPTAWPGAHANTDPHVTIGPMQYGPIPAASGVLRRVMRTMGV